MQTSSSLADWEVLIKKYIKDASIEDYNHEVVDGILYKAFAHKENTPEAKGQISHSETTNIGAKIDGSTNESILKALTSGAQALCFHLYRDTNIEALLQDVELNYIRSCFIIHDDSQVKNLAEYLDNSYVNNPLDYIITNKSKFNSKGIKKHFLLIDTKETEGMDALVDLCQQMNKVDQPICVELDLSNKFFFEIARLRALYILYANIKGQSTSPPLKIMVNLPIIDTKDELIQHTVSTLSAYLGGATIVNAGTINKDLSELSRLQINIQNVLQLESKLNLHHDPMAGSYFMEDLTHKICDKVWSKLN